MAGLVVGRCPSTGIFVHQLPKRLALQAPTVTGSTVAHVYPLPILHHWVIIGVRKAGILQ
jgi:hypothetical protein